ncbi:hypothetical protein MH215_21095 [Paenibacillus sp. ACRSA]|uniref:hypothetical protein n=1 Tax=Paenibacillus sp. ACRSA TaxID=2918211 RepID=UPI001EF6B318|nr:hypothetical protein [Paenibacillus sp. ACRSA]MCG7379498.1 hypothetical protein [Paenibacillus sp. ACRSA]
MKDALRLFVEKGNVDIVDCYLSAKSKRIKRRFSFIIDPVAELLEQQGVERISYLFAMLDLNYEGKLIQTVH